MRPKLGLGLAVAIAGMCLASAGGAQAQQATGTVVGQVTDARTEQPLASAQVVIAGTQYGALTNAQGRYTIPQVPVGAQTVRVILLGYGEENQPVTVPAGGSVTADFALSQSAVELNAVVVSAVTGAQERRKEIGSNVANINVDAINNGQVRTFADVLNGRTAGVDLKSVSGSIGNSQKIRIRGANSLSLSNEPIIIVDGMRYGLDNGAFGVGGQQPTRLNDLNPDDIANIEILKGPAASALYGTSAANGVVLITTKRGRAGKATWHAYAETGSYSDKNDYPLNYLAYSVLKPGAALTTSSGRFDATARKPCYNFQAAAGSCAQDSLMTFNSLRDSRTGPFITGSHRNFGMSVAGGTDVVRYYVSGDVQRDQGVISFNKNRQVNLRTNLDAHLRQNLDLSVSAGYTSGSLSQNNNDNSVFSPLINGLLGSAFYYPDVNGEANPRNYGFNYGVESLAFLPTLQDYNHFILGSRGNWRPLSWLSANATVGVDLVNLHEYDTLQPNSPLGSLAAVYDIGFRDSRQSNSFTYTGNGSATASFDLRPDLSSSTTLGASYQKNHLYGTYGFGAGIVAGTENLGAASSLYSVDEDFNEIITIGAFAQEKLAWKDRLFLSASIRTDDNSAFGKRYGRVYYPAASLSWVLSQEPFFPKTSWLSNVRLRTAYGASGLRPNFRQAITYYSPVATTVNGADVSSVTLSATGNELLKPERSTEYEAGIDVGLFDERVSAEFTYFNKKSHDALVSKPLPPSLGLTGSQFDNLGSVQNRGTELQINALAINTRPAKLNLRLSAATLSNKLISLGDVEPYSFDRGNQKMVEGFTAGGFWQKPYTYKDANGDGLIGVDEVTLTADTAVFMGPVLPTFTRSISGDLTLFNTVTIATLFDWRGGNLQSNQTESFRCQSAVGKGERGCVANMDPTASLAEQARFVAYRFKGTSFGYDEKANFVKWRELSVTLNVPPSLAERLGPARNLSLTVAGRNLKTWTDYSGLDPELNEIGDSSSTGGFGADEFNTQPPLRFYTVRLNFTF